MEPGRRSGMQFQVVAVAPLTEPPLQRRIVLALPATRQASTPVRCVVDLLVQCMKHAAARGDWPAARWLAD